MCSPPAAALGRAEAQPYREGDRGRHPPGEPWYEHGHHLRGEGGGYSGGCRESSREPPYRDWEAGAGGREGVEGRGYRRGEPYHPRADRWAGGAALRVGGWGSAVAGSAAEPRCSAVANSTPASVQSPEQRRKTALAPSLLPASRRAYGERRPQYENGGGRWAYARGEPGGRGDYEPYHRLEGEGYRGEYSRWGKGRVLGGRAGVCWWHGGQGSVSARPLLLTAAPGRAFTWVPSKCRMPQLTHAWPPQLPGVWPWGLPGPARGLRPAWACLPAAGLRCACRLLAAYCLTRSKLVNAARPACALSSLQWWQRAGQWGAGGRALRLLPLPGAEYDPELFPPMPAAPLERGGRAGAERDEEREAFRAELERVAAEMDKVGARAWGWAATRSSAAAAWGNGQCKASKAPAEHAGGGAQRLQLGLPARMLFLLLFPPGVPSCAAPCPAEAGAGRCGECRGATQPAHTA